MTEADMALLALTEIQSAALMVAFAYRHQGELHEQTQSAAKGRQGLRQCLVGDPIGLFG